MEKEDCKKGVTDQQTLKTEAVTLPQLEEQATHSTTDLNVEAPTTTTGANSSVQLPSQNLPPKIEQSVATAVFRDRLDALTDLIPQVLITLSSRLLSKSVISEEVRQDTLNPNVNQTARTSNLLQVVSNKIKYESQAFIKFVKTLESIESLKVQAEELVVKYQEYETQSKIHSLPPQSQVTSTTASASTNTTSNSLVSISDSRSCEQSSVDSAVKRQLHRNLDEIQTQYARYISHILKSVKKKEESASELKLFLRNLPAFKYRTDKEQHKLLDGKKKELKEKETIDDIFEFIGDEFSFLNHGIFQSIVDKYEIESNCDAMNYPQHLKNYLQKHTLSDFSKISQTLAKKCDPSKRKFTFKFDIELTKRLTAVYDLKQRIADILDLNDLELVDITEGCVIVTFLVPAHVADVIGQEFTPKQIEQFRELKVIWIESGGTRFLDFTDKAIDSANPSDLQQITQPPEAVVRETTQGDKDAVLTSSTGGTAAGRTFKETKDISGANSQKLSDTENFQNYSSSPEVTTSIQDIASHCEVCEAWLDREITRNKFYEISGYLPKWKLLAPLLKVTPAEVKDIAKKVDTQKIRFLEKWKQKMGIKATYRALMEALLGINRENDAKGVCQVLKAMYTPERSQAPIPKLQAQTVCNVCLGTCTNPKMLQCQHVYCQRCLEKLVKDQSVTCPECRRVTSVSASGVKGLQSSTHTIQFPSEGAGNVEVPTSPHATSPPPAKREFCREHGKRKVEWFCETCDEFICYECAAKWGGHHDHNYKEVSEAAEKCRQEMTASLEPVKKRFIELKEALAKLEGRRKELSKQQTDVEVDLQRNYRKFYKTLDNSKNKLIMDLDKSFQEKLEKLAVLRDQVEDTLARLNKCLANMESLETESHEEVLAKKTKLAEQVEELTSMPLPDQLEPLTEVTFSHNVNLSAYCQENMQIVERRSTESTNEEDDLAEPSEKLEISGDDAGLVEVEEIDPAGPMDIPQEETCVMFEIVTSPETAAIYRTSSPWDVPINQRRGEVVVIKLGAEHITLVPKGSRLKSFGRSGTGRVQFQFPSAVEVDGVGNILVADCYNHRIQHFTPKGKFIREAGSYNSGDLQLKFPSGIAFNKRNNKIYVTDSQNVLVLNSDLTHNFTFSKHSSREGYRPCGIACDSDGNVYVPDYEGHCIRVYTPENDHKLVKTFGQFGDEGEQLESPSHVAVDSQDNVYVSEKSRVSVFTPKNYEFLTSYSSPGNRPKEFLPRGVAVDSNGVVYACDWVNNCVQILY